jgi:UDP-GlcNAc:undecaprenyl-phosphate GlcNAc-1-phosphate transferase
VTSAALVLHGIFAFAIAVLSAALTALLIRYGNIIDVPNQRSSHTVPTPKGGGIAIVASFVLGILLIHLIGQVVPIKTRYFVGFFIGSFAIAAVSLYDDFKYCTMRTKLVVHSVAIMIALGSGIVIDWMQVPWFGAVNWGWWGYPLTLLWILGLTNAFNFMDGLDGLAASTAVVAAVFFSFITFQQGSHFIYLASLTLAAATLGFLIFNFPPAKIFMGDVGSVFLGFAFAVMAVIAARYDLSHTSMLVVPLLLFHFIFDAMLTFVRRLTRGEDVTLAHRTHLYQLLNQLGWSHGKVTLLYSCMAFVQGLAAIWMVKIPGEPRLSMFLPLVFLQLSFSAWVLRKARQMQLI